MDKEIIIRSGATKIDYALTKDGRLIELHADEDENKFAVSDIFIAKTRKVLSGLNASFVDVGYEKDGFLHYHDLGPQYLTQLKFTKQVISGRRKNYALKDIKVEKELEKSGSITDVIAPNQHVTGAGSQRTYIHKRTSPKCRALHTWTLCGSSSIL